MGSFTLYEQNKYRMKININNKGLPISETDRINAGFLNDIYEKLEQPYRESSLLWGKQTSGNLSISTYLDRVGTILNTIRDLENSVVIIELIRR